MRLKPTAAPARQRRAASLRTLMPHYRTVLRLGTPIAIGQTGVILLSFADTMMVGRYSTEALAAASFTNNLFNLVTCLLLGYSYGLTPIVSSLCGRGCLRRAGASLKAALAANALFALVLLAVMATLYFFLDRMGQPPAILPLVRPYYLVILVSMVFVMLFNVLRQFTDGLSHTAVGMWVLLGGNVLNILGNWLLIYGIGPLPEWGLLGAGVSTLVSRVLMVAAMAAVVLTGRHYARCRTGFALTRLRAEALRRIHRLSLPVSLQIGMETGAFTASGIMAGWLGTLPLATYQVMLSVGTLGYLIYYSYGAALSIRVGIYLGQGDLTQLRRAAQAGCHVLLGLSLLVALTFLAAGRPLTALFTDDAAVAAMAAALIPPLMLYQIGDAMQICYSNALRGTGHVESMMPVAFVSYVAINIPAAYLLAFPAGLGLTGIYLAFSSGLFVAAALFARQFRRVVAKL